MHNGDALAEHPVIQRLEDFDVHSGSVFERLLFNNRLVIVLLCIVMTLGMGYQSLSLRLNASFEKMIPVNHPYIVNFLMNRANLGGLGNTLRIAVEKTDGSIFDAHYMETLRKINDEVFLLPGVNRPFMKSLWTPVTRWIAVTEDGLEGGPVIPDSYDGSAASIEQLKANVERSGEIGQLVSPNYKSTILYIPIEGGKEAAKRLEYHKLSVRLEELRAKYETGTIKIHITGFAKVVGDLIDGLQQMLMFFAIAIAICMSVLYWYTRCVRSTLLVVFCSLIAVVWLLGILPTMSIELDPYSVLVPFLVFAIGMSHGAQKMNGIMQDIGRGTHRLVAARYTFRRLFLAGTTALLADAAGFAVLMVIDIGVIHDLAITASAGVGVLIFTNLVLLPILLSYTGVSPSAAKISLKAEIESEQDDSGHKKHPFWAFLDLFTRRKYASIALIVSAILGLSGFLVSLNLKVGDLDPGAPELRPNSRYNRDSAFMVENYSASSDVYVVMVKTPQFKCVQYETLAQIDALEAKLISVPGVESTNSYASLSKKLAAGMNEGSLKWYELPRTQDMLNNITTRAPRELFNYNCDLLTVYIYLKDHKADTLDGVVKAVEDFAKRNNTEEIKFLSAAGNAGIEAATNIVVKQANKEMLFLVYLAVIALGFITFRSWRAVVCAIVPLLLTSILCEALMVALGIGIKVATLPVVALGVGIGVDYALYIMTVTLSRMRSGLSLSQAYYKALLFTGKVVVLTGVTLGIAVSTWAFSPIKFQADMGILLAFMFLWNMLGALILIPALAAFLLKPAVSVQTYRTRPV